MAKADFNGVSGDKNITYKIGDIDAITVKGYLRKDDEVTGDRQIRFANLYGILQNLSKKRLESLKEKCLEAFKTEASPEKKQYYKDGFEAIRSILTDRVEVKKNRKAFAAYN